MIFETTEASRGIIILGMHRGGTSLLANLVHLWGAYADQEMLIPGDAYNPRGYWEPSPLVRLNDDLLAAVQSRWCVPPAGNAVESVAAMAQQQDFRKRALNLLLAAHADQRPWFWKDPRLSILLPFWKQFWGNIVYLVSVREPGDIAESLRHRDGMSASASLLLWQKYMSDILADEDVRSTAAFFAYENILTDPKRECGRLCRLLDQRFGLGQPEPDGRIEAMATAIDERFWRNRGNIGLLSNALATDVQRRLQHTLLLRSVDEQVNSSEEFPIQTDCREILADEENRRSTGVVTAQCRVYWRDSRSGYSQGHSAYVGVTLDGAPQRLEIAIPCGDDGVAIAIRIDLADRPAEVALTAMEVRDSKRNLVWAWDGRPDSITALPHHEVASCIPLRGETGCLLQLQGFDPWLEIALDAEEAAATAGGALIVLQCTYSSSLEYALFANGRRTDEVISRLQKLEARQAGVHHEAASRFQQMEAEQGKLRQEIISRLQRLEDYQITSGEQVVSRLQNVEEEQASLRQEVELLRQIEEGQDRLRQEVLSRFQRLEAAQAELQGTMQGILNSRIWKVLAAVGGAVLRVTNGRD